MSFCNIQVKRNKNEYKVMNKQGKESILYPVIVTNINDNTYDNNKSYFDDLLSDGKIQSLDNKELALGIYSIAYNSDKSEQYWLNENRYLELLKPSSITLNNEVGIKEGVLEVFKDNPELSNIGTPQQYSNYLETIFPESKVKDIVYHFSNVKIDKPNKEKFSLSANINRKRGFFGISENINPGNNFANVEGTIPHAMLFDMKNPDSGDFSVIPPVTAKDETKDSAIIKQRGGINYYAVFEPEQIHILSSKADIQGFKNFMSFENSEFSKYGTYQQFRNFIISKSSIEIENKLIETDKIDRVC